MLPLMFLVRFLLIVPTQVIPTRVQVQLLSRLALTSVISVTSAVAVRRPALLQCPTHIAVGQAWFAHADKEAKDRQDAVIHVMRSRPEHQSQEWRT